MWTYSELAKIAKTFNDSVLEDILTPEEIAVIPSSAIPNLRQTIIQPKHHNKVRFVIFINFNSFFRSKLYKFNISSQT